MPTTMTNVLSLLRREVGRVILTLSALGMIYIYLAWTLPPPGEPTPLAGKLILAGVLPILVVLLVGSHASARTLLVAVLVFGGGTAGLAWLYSDDALYLAAAGALGGLLILLCTRTPRFLRARDALVLLVLVAVWGGVCLAIARVTGGTGWLSALGGSVIIIGMNAWLATALNLKRITA